MPNFLFDILFFIWHNKKRMEKIVFFIKCLGKARSFRKLFLQSTVKDNTVFWCCFFYLKQRFIPETGVGELMANVQGY